MTTSPDYDGPVYVGVEQDEPELVDADVDPGPVPAAGEREEWLVLCPTCHSTGPCYFLDSGNAMPYWHTEKLELIDSEAAVAVVHPEPAEERAAFDPRLHEALMTAKPYQLADRWTHMLDNQPHPDDGTRAIALCRTPGAQRLHVDWRAVNCPMCRAPATPVLMADATCMCGRPIEEHLPLGQCLPAQVCECGHALPSHGPALGCPVCDCIRPPDVPVVHPEPGGRAARYAKAWQISCGLSVQPWDAFLVLADMEVAAAVAAVRADLAAQIEELVPTTTRHWTAWKSGRAAAAALVRGPAAAVRSATKEES